MAVEEFAEMPAIGPLTRRAAADALGSALARVVGRPRDIAGSGAPARQLLVRGVSTDVDHLARYSRVCGFRLSGALPPTYPHVLAFPLTLDLMTRREFPFALAGLVHIRNTIEQRRPIVVGERLNIAVEADNLRAHKRGHVIDIVTTGTATVDTATVDAATVDAGLVWRERSSYLRTGGRSGPRHSAPAHHLAAPSALWQVAANVGSAYARVSGDRNPIHTSTMAARAFGFPRPIAHGMWSIARCLAALEGRLPDSYVVEVSAKLPLLLPTTVAFWTADDLTRFGLRDAASGRPHLDARLLRSP